MIEELKFGLLIFSSKKVLVQYKQSRIEVLFLIILL